MDAHTYLLRAELANNVDHCAECGCTLDASNDGGGIEIDEGFICTDCDAAFSGDAD